MGNEQPTSEAIATGEYFRAYESESESQIVIEIDGVGSREFEIDELENFIDESKQLRMLTIDDNDEYEVFRWAGQCHECGHEGEIIENSIGTVLCPKCRSTNVGWDTHF